MSLTKLTENLNNVSSLSDKPSIETEELKQVFDKAGNSIKSYINEVLTEELDNLISNNYNTLNNLIEENANTITTAQLNKIYPIGSIYMSVNSTDPSELMGGTWERLKDQFLLGAGDTYTAGETGGEATHTLTASEMPSHTHTYSKSATTSGSTTLTENQIPSHGHGISATTAKLGTGSYYVSSSGSTKIGDLTISKTATTGGGQGHTHSITLSSANTGSKGSGTAHNNMPPYLTVYMWKRVS